MKTETEITTMLKHCIEKDGTVSPSVIDTLEWVLGAKLDKDCDQLFDLGLYDYKTGEYKTSQ